MASRLMKFKIPIDILIDILTTGKTVKQQCVSGLPIGTKYIHSYVDVSTMLIYIVVEHGSFEKLEMGEIIPEITIRLASLEETHE